MKHKLFLSAVLIFFQSLLFAHNPYQSSLKLSINEHSGILEINLAQYGVELALLKKHPELDVKSIELKAYKELIINYLKENIHITVNEQQLIIGKGVIKLGSHQTDLKFQIDNIPQDPQYVDVYAPCFQENDKQQNFFRLIYNRLTVRKKLTQANNFRTKFTITESAILVNGKTETLINSNAPWVVATISLISVILFSVFKFRKSPKDFNPQSV